LLPNVGIALAPVAAACGLIEPRANVVAHYLIPAAFAWPMVLGASYRGLPLLVTYLGSAILLAAVLTAYLHSAVWLYAAVLLLPIVLPLSVAPLRRQSARLDRRRSIRLAALHPIRAMVRRDLLCLVRCERKRFVILLASSGLSPAMMLAFRLNGDVAGREALWTAAVFFSLVAATVYYPLERLKLQLGKEFARLRWPVSAFDRALALTLLFGVLLTPSALLIGLFGSTMGYARGLAFLSFVLTTISIGAWTFARHLRTNRATIGAYLLTLVAHGCILFALPGRIYVPLAATVSALGLLKTTTLLKHHMVDAEDSRAAVA
jgi:hypothetical protein